MRNAKQEILDFWFEQTQPRQWFQKNAEFDSLIRERFFAIHEMARDGLCDAWEEDAEGCLALCILLDQFPRNMFRDSPEAFATDAKALRLAAHAISKGFDQILPVNQRRFIYLPYEHSESLNDQRRAVELFGKMKKDDPLGYDYALRHLEIIEKFGRFPHRNAVLGRQSTPSEMAWLAAGSGF